MSKADPIIAYYDHKEIKCTVKVLGCTVKPSEKYKNDFNVDYITPNDKRRKNRYQLQQTCKQKHIKKSLKNQETFLIHHKSKLKKYVWQRAFI